MKKNRRQVPTILHHTLILLAAGALFIVFTVTIQPFHSFNSWLTDKLILTATPSPNIIVVGIDDETLAAYGRWAEWPRELHARAIRNLNDGGARVVGMDILFSDGTDDDTALVAAMEQAGNVILPLVGTQSQSTTDSTGITYEIILTPTPLLSTASASLGHGNILPGRDGTVRHLPLIIQDTDGNQYPAFTLALLHYHFSTPLPDYYAATNGTIRLLNRDIPVAEELQYRINFSPDYRDRPYLSYLDVIRGDFDSTIVKDKIVLVGMVATGELDKWIIPNATSKVPGVFIHATVMDNILQQNFLAETGLIQTALILFGILTITAVTLPRLGLRWGAVAVSVLLIGYLSTSFIAFDNGYVLNLLYPLALLPFVYGSSSLTRNVAMAIDNTRLNREVLEGYKSTIKALAAAIDAKDHYTRGHSSRVTELTLLAANHLNMTAEEREILEYAAILHDVGKIGIPDGILNKNGPLTSEEMDYMRQHPVIGAGIMEGVPFLQRAREIALHHHEKYNGTGYPAGKSGTEIPRGARLLAVADAFDSMTSNRSYRAATNSEAAIRELLDKSGTQFCPDAVKAFIRAYRENQESAQTTDEDK